MIVAGLINGQPEEEGGSGPQGCWYFVNCERWLWGCQARVGEAATRSTILAQDEKATVPRNEAEGLGTHPSHPFLPLVPLTSSRASFPGKTTGAFLSTPVVPG